MPPEKETTTESTTTEQQETQEVGSTETGKTTSTTETATEQQTAETGKEKETPAPPWGSDEEFDPDKAWKLIQNLRGDIDELKPQAAELKKIRDAEKSDLERIQDELETERSEHSSTQVELAKVRAAVKYGLSEDDLELLPDAGTPEQIDQRAKRLADRLAGASEDDPLVPASRGQGGGTDPAGIDLDKVVDKIPPS